MKNVKCTDVCQRFVRRLGGNLIFIEKDIM